MSFVPRGSQRLARVAQRMAQTAGIGQHPCPPPLPLHTLGYWLDNLFPLFHHSPLQQSLVYMVPRCGWHDFYCRMVWGVCGLSSTGTWLSPCRLPPCPLSRSCELLHVAPPAPKSAAGVILWGRPSQWLHLHWPAKPGSCPPARRFSSPRCHVPFGRFAGFSRPQDPRGRGGELREAFFPLGLSRIWAAQASQHICQWSSGWSSWLGVATGKQLTNRPTWATRTPTPPPPTDGPPGSQSLVTLPVPVSLLPVPVPVRPTGMWRATSSAHCSCYCFFKMYYYHLTLRLERLFLCVFQGKLAIWSTKLLRQYVCMIEKDVPSINV